MKYTKKSAKILRFKNEDVLTNIKNVLKVIKNHLVFPSPSRMSPPQADKLRLMERDVDQKIKVNHKSG